MRVSIVVFLMATVWASSLSGEDPAIESPAIVFKAEAKSKDTVTALTFGVGEPIIVRADIKVPAGDHYIRWRVRGDVEYETFERETVLVVGWNPGEYEAEFLFIQKEPFKVVEEQFSIIVQGARPPPVDPDEPVTPDNPVVSGDVASYVFAVQAKLSIDESTMLAEIREWADDEDVTHYVFAPDAENPDGSVNQKVKKYYDMISHGATYPYGFLVKKGADGEGVVVWSGELRSSSSYIEKIEGLNDDS